MQSKQCFKCLKTLPLSEFYKHSQMGDGHLNKCKECAKHDTRSNRATRVEYYNKYETDRLARKRHVSSEKRTRLASLQIDHMTKRTANVIVGNALRDGKIQKEPCFVCGNNAHAHHASYSLPLDVTWLCPKHHRQVHVEHREYLLCKF